MGAHIVGGRFQSDKYPTCPAGKVPLSTKDVTAQDLLWRYAQRRRAVDAEFADDLETCLRADGFDPNATFDMSLGVIPVRSPDEAHKLADDGNCPECSAILGSPSPCAITHDFGPGAYDFAPSALGERPLTLDAAIAHLEAYEAAQRGKEQPTFERRDRASVALAAVVPRLLAFLRGQKQAPPAAKDERSKSSTIERLAATIDELRLWLKNDDPAAPIDDIHNVVDAFDVWRADVDASAQTREQDAALAVVAAVMEQVSRYDSETDYSSSNAFDSLRHSPAVETWRREFVLREPLPPYPGDPEDTTLRDLAALRAHGWTVAVHNDYRLDGKAHTFWLFTKGERAVKGEGETDAAALAIVAERAGLVKNGLPTPQGLSLAVPAGERARYRYKPGPRHAWPIYEIDRTTMDMGFVWVGDTQPSPEQMAAALRGEIKLQATHTGFLITGVMGDPNPEPKREVLHRSHAPGTSVLDLVLLAIRHLGEADVPSQALGGPKSPAYERYASAMTACGSALDDARRALMGLP